MVVLRVPLELAGADTEEGQAVPVGLVHVGLDLEDEGGEILAEDIHLPLVADPGQGGCGEVEELLQEGLHAEVREGGAEEHRGELTIPDGVEIEVPARAQELDLLPQGVRLGIPDELIQGGALKIRLHQAGLAALALGGEEEDAALFPVIDALELLAAADGPVHGVGVDAQLPLHLLAEVQGVLGLPVHLVDEGEDGDMAHGADPEELAGLGLHALGAVDDHDGAVRRHEGAVGILGEVLVAGGVQDVDAVAIVLELHDGAGDGNAALLLDLHPVRSSGFRPLALDLAGLGDGSAVEQELFRESGLTGVRVGDDGKGPPPGDLFL